MIVLIVVGAVAILAISLLITIISRKEKKRIDQIQKTVQPKRTAPFLCFDKKM